MNLAEDTTLFPCCEFFCDSTNKNQKQDTPICFCAVEIGVWGEGKTVCFIRVSFANDGNCLYMHPFCFVVGLLLYMAICCESSLFLC